MCVLKMEENKELSEEEVLNSLDNESLLNVINNFLPENQKISNEKGMILIPESKKVIMRLKKLGPIKEDFELGIDFLKEAEKDLKRSKRSYLEKDFSDAIYHLQQVTEKIMKSYGLIQGTFTKKDLFDINHQTPKAFIKMVQEQNMELFLTSIKILYPDLNTNMTNLQETIESKNKEIALLTAKELNSHLDLAEKLDEALSKTDLDNILKDTLPKLSKLQGNETPYPTFSIMKFTSIFIKMYLISIMTYPHEAFTRYPDRDIKPSQYNESLGIVQVAPRIFILLDETVCILNEFITWKNEIAKTSIQTN